MPFSLFSRRSRLVEAKLRESLDFFNDRPNFGLRRDGRRTSYQLAAEIEAVLAVPTFWQRIRGDVVKAAIAAPICLTILILGLEFLPGGGL